MSKSSHAARAARARAVLPGYPKEPFKSYDEAREYFSGEFIVCLLCGRLLRRLSGPHLMAIHNTTEDDYRARFNLPWRRGLTSSVAHDNYSAATLKRIAEGDVHLATPEEQKKAAEAARNARQTPFKRVIGLRNLGLPDDAVAAPPFIGPPRPGRRQRQSVFGSEEYHAKMRARPQLRTPEALHRLRTMWIGKKQTPEHIAKRFAKKRAERKS